MKKKFHRECDGERSLSRSRCVLECSERAILLGIVDCDSFQVAGSVQLTRTIGRRQELVSHRQKRLMQRGFLSWSRQTHWLGQTAAISPTSLVNTPIAA